MRQAPVTGLDVSWWSPPYLCPQTYPRRRVARREHHRHLRYQRWCWPLFRDVSQTSSCGNL